MSHSCPTTNEAFTIMQKSKMENGSGSSIFTRAWSVDAPTGYGKTYMANAVLIYPMRAEGFSVFVSATTSIAATNYDGGLDTGSSHKERTASLLTMI